MIGSSEKLFILQSVIVWGIVFFILGNVSMWLLWEYTTHLIGS